ncbi:MAG: chemotaxis protein [Alphaproteobacteria bacterium]|jgi:methyl-accepting chemotaxis protein|nr:chemotaxis protein [Alphaproteobacteria bacterium]
MLNRAPLSRKLMLIMVAALIGMAAIGWAGLRTLEHNLILDRQSETRNLVSAAVDAVEALYVQAETGALTEDSAQTLARDVIRTMAYGDGDYFFVVDQAGTMLAHGANADLEGRDVTGLEDENGVRLIEGLIAEARAGGGFVPYVWPRDANGEPIDKLSYAELFEPWGWVVATGIYIDDVEAVYWDELFATLAIGLAIAALLGGTVFAIARSVTGPVNRLSLVMKALADGDHGIEIPARGWKNEVGTMADSVQIFKENAIEKVRLEAERKAAEERAEQEKRETMARVADDFESSVGGIVRAVTDAATEMQSTSHSMTGISDEANRQSAMVASAAQQAAANVQTVASAAEELGSSIAEISRQVQTQRDVAGVASEAATATNEDITTLAGRAEKIGEVIGLITGIAEQTNLLALNATIEAARAGEAGKGFAVVASEVKNLANQTARATDEIAEQIRAMQDQTGRTVTSIGTITGKIAELNEISAAVAAAVEQQNSATQEIARNANEAASGTHQVTESIEGVSRAASETGTASSEVLQAAESLSRDAARLSDEVKGFLQTIRAA